MNKSADQSPLVWVVVLNCNGMDVLPDCLRTLRESDYPNLKVCISDNSSTDGSPEWAEEHESWVDVIRNHANLGWSAANNVGIRYAMERGADYVWILNNDVEVEPDCIRRLIDHAEAHPECGIVGPVIHYFDDEETAPWFAGGFIDYDRLVGGHCRSVEDFATIQEPNRFISGCAMMVKRKVFNAIGLIDEQFFIYHEDTDFNLRAGRYGFTKDLVPEARMFHKVSSFSGGEDSVSPWRLYQEFRSGLLFWKKQLGTWKFHRDYCHRHLGKYLKFVDDRGESDIADELGQAVLDALWYVHSRQQKPLEHPVCPDWYARLVARRTWVYDRLAAWRPLDLLRIATGPKQPASIQGN